MLAGFYGTRVRWLVFTGRKCAGWSLTERGTAGWFFTGRGWASWFLLEDVTPSGFGPTVLCFSLMFINFVIIP